MLKIADTFAKNNVTRLTMAFCLVFPAIAPSQTANSQQMQSTAGVSNKNFTGIWQLNESTTLKNQRSRAIKNATASLGRFKRSRALEVMQKMTAPPRELKIVDDGNQVQISRAGGEAVVGIDGRPVTIDSPRGKATLRATKRDGRLIVESKLANATTTVVYQLSDDGNTLNQQIEIVANKLPTPVRFTNSYRR